VDASGIGPVAVFVAHFKSSRPVPLRRAPSAAAPAEADVELPAKTPRERAEGAVRSSVWRVAEALFVRDRVDEVLARDAGARVAVVGDLNDLPDSLALRTLRAEGPGQLMDCTTGVAPALRYSTLHGGDRVQIDHVLSTCDLHARLESATFFNGELREHPPLEEGRAERLTLDSDHAPLVVRFRA
ncbi:MAG: hypothetical protein M3O46_08030, partial [Myxococcota bacterium]|nr:hypothetical protein [Myxococcota bacterium]